MNPRNWTSFPLARAMIAYLVEEDVVLTMTGVRERLLREVDKIDAWRIAERIPSVWG